MNYCRSVYRPRIELVFLLSIALSSCSLLFQSQYSDYPLERELQRSDLPASWYRLGGTFEEIKNAVYSHVVAYGPDVDRENKMISQQLTIYASESDAKSYFEEWRRRWFPTVDWREPAGWEYEPMSTDDLYHLGCQKFSINSEVVLSCGYLQQHDEYISLLLANIDGEEVTKEIFLAALEAQDIRLNK